MAQGKLYKRVANDVTHLNYYEGDKLVAQKIHKEGAVFSTYIRYFYDIEGVCGFKIGTGEKYLFAKDA